MPRFITVNVQCDWAECPVTGVEGDGTIVERTMSLDGKQAKAFLVCTGHSNDLDAVILPLLQSGIKVEKGKAAAAVAVDHLECKDCGRDDIKNKAGLAQHVMRSHGFESLAAYEEKYHVHID